MDDYHPNYEGHGWPDGLPGSWRQKRRLRVSRSKRLRVLKKHGFKCKYCEKPLSSSPNHPTLEFATMDHVIPVSLGGTNNESNLVPACGDCNREKGNKSP